MCIFMRYTVCGAYKMWYLVTAGYEGHALPWYAVVYNAT